jgi:hypothetical protein
VTERLRCGGTALFDPESGIGYRCTRCLAIVGSIGQPERCRRLAEAEALSYPGVTAFLMRRGRYPYGDRPGEWDTIEFTAASREDAERFARACEGKFWRRWILGRDAETHQRAGLLYKPSGARSPWEDD